MDCQRQALIDRYGANLDANSHGESFLRLFNQTLSSSFSLCSPISVFAISLFASHCNFETAISITLWTARSMKGLVASKIAEIRIAAKQAQGHAFESDLR